MGRLFVELDPAGYYRIVERGAVVRLKGNQVIERLGSGPDIFQKGNFWLPPGSQWLLAKPRQWNADWYKDLRMQYHVIRKSAWTFATGLPASEVDEVQFTRTPEGFDKPHNVYMSFHCPDTWTSMDARDFSKVEEACSIPTGSLPTGFKTIAVATSAPDGYPLCGSADIAPWLGFEHYPRPHDWLMFGWGIYAVLFNAGHWWLLRNDNNDGKTWKLIKDGAGDLPNPAHPEAIVGTTDFGLGIKDETTERAYFACTPVGFDNICVSLGANAHHLIRVRETSQEEQTSGVFSGGSSIFGLGSGSWWIAAAPKDNVTIQVQVIGYEAADTNNIPGAKALMFGLGRNYKPTSNPNFGHRVLMHLAGGGTSINTATANNEDTLTITPGTSTEKAVVGLYDLAGSHWVSDGTRYEGTFRIRLQPDEVTTHGYLCPQLKHVFVTFPRTTVARPNNSLVLDDTQWSRLQFEVALREVLGKRMEFYVTERASAIIGDRGLDVREGYPVHLLEELIDGDPESRIVRARWWMEDVGRTDFKTEGKLGGPPVVRRTKFSARGILQRADERWYYLPELIDPNSQYIEHTFALRAALQAASLDPDDATLFSFYTDPFAGTDISRLPVVDQEDDLGSDLEDEGAIQPDWHEHKIQYMVRVAEEWRGWIFYEGMSKIYYHPDLQYAVQVGHKYFPIVTFYRTTQEAAEAGHPDQYFLLNPERWMSKLPFNVIQVSGKAPEKERNNPNIALHYIERNNGSITNIDDPEQFLGDERIEEVVSKFAVSEKALSRLCRVRMKKNGHRKFGWRWSAKKLPWDMAYTGLDHPDVGKVATVMGRGDQLIVHMSCSIEGRGNGAIGTYVARTQFSGENFVLGAVAGSDVYDYPGRGRD